MLLWVTALASLLLTGAVQAQSKVVAIDDIPVCNDLVVAEELMKYAVSRNEAAYKRMFETYGKENICATLLKGAVVTAMRLHSGNIVEMVTDHGSRIYGPGMMLEPVR